MFLPYTYYLYHKPTGLKYYGSKTANNKNEKANPDNLWKTYFSSSRKVHRLIEEYGADSFHVEVRRTFKTKLEALAWEEQVLRRLKVTTRDDWLNDRWSGTKLPGNVALTKDVKERISKTMKGRKNSVEHNQKISEAKRGSVLSDTHKESIRKAKEGVHNSPEHNEAIRQARLSMGDIWLVTRRMWVSGNSKGTQEVLSREQLESRSYVECRQWQTSATQRV